MSSYSGRDWMWSEACSMLARAERLHRQTFTLVRSAARTPVWEPPVDILETDYEVLVFVALPGVDPASVDAAIDGDELILAGTRTLPDQLRNAVIHRLELPQGRFERRVQLPAGRYSAVRRSAADGCVLIILDKSGATRG